MLHAEHFKDVLLEILIEFNAGDIGDDKARKCRTPVRIGSMLARWVYAFRLVFFQGFCKRHDAICINNNEIPKETVLEATSVGHDVP